MKKLISNVVMNLKFIFSSCFIIAVLGSSFTALAQAPKPKTATSAAGNSAAAKKPAVTKQEIEEGKLLISKSDCMACHSLDAKLVGPSYVEVAKKYPVTDANINKLSLKIINGGSGVWGQIPMVPHATVSSDDSKKMVKYILSLNTGKK